MLLILFLLLIFILFFLFSGTAESPALKRNTQPLADGRRIAPGKSKRRRTGSGLRFPTHLQKHDPRMSMKGLSMYLFRFRLIAITSPPKSVHRVKLHLALEQLEDRIQPST